MPQAFTSLRGRIEHLLQIDPQSKPLVYLQVFKAAEIMSLNYALELLLSAGIATLGLVLNSPAVVIGAMLISPLMGPILAAGLALAASDLYLGIKSLISIVLSMIAAVLFSALLVWLLPFQSPTTEILARTQPNLLDLGIALFSGLAGSIVVSRGGGGGGVTALPGVAIAVALMPPLCTLGFGVGSGMSWAIISGAGLLFLTNLAAIIASAFLVFYIVRMDSPDIRMKIGYTEMEHASPDRLYKLLEKTRLSKSLGDIGHLRWRILMLLVCLGILFFPLRKSLYQLRDETVSRSVVLEAVRSLGPADALLTQQVDLEPSQIVVHLAVASPVPAERIREAERMIIRRTGKEASVLVRKVASEEELALLRERLTPPPPEPPPQTMESMRADMLGRLEPLLKETWPTETTPLLGYEIGFTPEDVVVRIRYESRKPMDTGAQEILTKLLESRLQTPKLRLVMEQERPSPRKRRRNSVPMAFLPAFLATGNSQPANLAVAMLIIFGSAKLLAELFERFGTPGIVGEILAGILIGPSVLAWISPDDFTTAMAGLGVMFLLFKVGLEVDSGELIKLGGTSLAVGVLGVTVPFVCGMAFYQLAGMPRMEAIFLGTALTATSVGITAQVLSARGLLHRTASKIILGAAIIDDILALLLLGVVTSLAEGRVNILELGLTSGLAVIFIVLIARWGRHTMGRVVARLEGKLRVGEGEFALAMVLLFGLAALSTWIGVAAIIGAFLAGMTLSGSSPRRVHDLAQGVTELLVPFFLAGIGLHLNLQVFQDSRTVVLALLLVPVAVISKLLACGLGAARFGPQIAMRVGAGMIPRGEFCMVVAQVGLTLKAISDGTFAIIVFMAVVAATLAPPLLRWTFRAVLDEAPVVERTPDLW